MTLALLRGGRPRALADPLINFTSAMRDFAGESRTTSWRRIKRGEIPAVRVGGRWKIHRSDFLSLLSRLETEGRSA